MPCPLSPLRCGTLALCAALAAAPGIQAGAAAQTTPKPSPAVRNNTLHFDPAGTQVRFTLRSLLRTVHGSFPLKGGALAVDPSSGLAQGEILVDATAGKTGNKGTETRMKQVLESDRYPAIFFHAEHLKGKFPERDGAADLQADGTLNIHGADHPLQMTVHLERHGDEVTATTHFTVPYVAWGMRDPSTALTRYSKQVEVDVDAKASMQAVKTKTSHGGEESSDSGMD